MKNKVLGILTILILAACSITRETPAPVVNVTKSKTAQSQSPVASSSSKPLANDEDGATEAVINKIPTSNSNETVISDSPAPGAKLALPASAIAANKSTKIGDIDFLTPTSGTITQAYSVSTKGVNISGREGQPILASAAGKVAYSGNGLKGYGNLIIVKHQDGYLTAYSHNKVNLVKEGAQVKRGQKIAELGKTDSDKPVLHFELRKDGKPIDPSSLFK